jgi:hypothetical protein
MTVLAACHGSERQQPSKTGSGAFEIVTKPVLLDGGAGPSASDEVEPNDGEDVATPLALGATLRGKLDADGDVDMYRIEVAQAGALSVSVTGIEGYDLALDVEDASGALLARSDRGGARVLEGIPNLGVQPGRYTIVVRGKRFEAAKPKPKKLKKGEKPAVVPDAPKGASPVYELTAKVAAPSGNIEREPDDDRGTAIDLIVGDPASGFVGWTNDADVWKLNVEALSAKNAIDIEVSAVEGTALALEVADGIGQPLLSRKGPRGAPLIVRGLVPVVPAGAPPYHYLTVRGDKSNPETPYQIKVVAHDLVPDGEIEPDDTPEHPMVMPADRTSLKGTWTPGDADCYALAVTPAARTVEATLDPKDVDLALELVVEGKVVAKADHPGAGAEEKLSGSVPAGKKAVFRVRGADASATGEGTYDIAIQDTGAP